MPIKLLIVDDSALMRRQLTQLFTEAGGFEICTVRNGVEAIEENMSFEADVITLDINMPEMDGLTALSCIMTARPVPVIMVSSLTAKGALATFEALALGAVDFVAKPGGTISLSINTIANELINKVRAAVKAKPKTQAFISEKINKKKIAPSLRGTSDDVCASPSKNVITSAEGVVIIGVSTGGPGTLEHILPNLSETFPLPIIIAQHMPSSFTGHFAERMNKICALTVKEINQPYDLEAGTIYIGKGGADIGLTKRAGRLMVLPKPESAGYLWHPSVEGLARAVLEYYNPQRIIGVMLTGMGNDGSEGFAEIHKKGGRTIAESEDSCVVFGMPKELIGRSGATKILPMEKIAAQLESWAKSEDREKKAKEKQRPSKHGQEKNYGNYKTHNS